MEASAASETATDLERTLLEFQAAPSRYKLGLREPALAFSSLDEVIQLAIGRDAAGTGASRAARYFVRKALFAPDADHYRVLGLAHTATVDDIKKRYRLLMRLLHPDFAGDDTSGWEADAAVRVNLAYETLSSSERRVEYDRQLASPEPAAAPAPMRRRRPQRKAAGPNFRGTGARIAMGASFLIAMMFVGLLIVTNQGPGSVLVQQLPEAAAPEHDPPVMQKALHAVARVAHDLSASVVRTQAAEAPAAPPAPALPPASPPVEQVRPVQPPTVVAAESATPTAVAAPVVVLAPPAPAAAAPAAAAPPPASPPPRPVDIPTPSVAEAQPILLQLLQRMESGNGSDLLGVVDASSRGTSDAQALAAEYTQLTQGGRVRIVGVQFRGEPREGRLFVRGAIKLGPVEAPQTVRDFALVAEFAQRPGGVVLTRLAPADR